VFEVSITLLVINNDIDIVIKNCNIVNVTIFFFILEPLAYNYYSSTITEMLQFKSIDSIVINKTIKQYKKIPLM